MRIVAFLSIILLSGCVSTNEAYHPEPSGNSSYKMADGSHDVKRREFRERAKRIMQSIRKKGQGGNMSPLRLFFISVLVLFSILIFGCRFSAASSDPRIQQLKNEKAELKRISEEIYDNLDNSRNQEIEIERLKEIDGELARKNSEIARIMKRSKDTMKYKTVSIRTKEHEKHDTEKSGVIKPRIRLISVLLISCVLCYAVWRHHLNRIPLGIDFGPRIFDGGLDPQRIEIGRVFAGQTDPPRRTLGTIRTRPDSAHDGRIPEEFTGWR